ncbi:MAG: hypothetical protein LBL32_02880 [Holosporales bacterium]|jgi:DNA-binding transcriptional LysR family regulator|nr:hypothetical protein [Holosporales bacterium]
MLGFSEACRASRYVSEEGMMVIRDLQESWGIDLFTHGIQPSIETLTDSGRNFLPSVDKLLLNYINGFLDIYNHKEEENISRILRIKSTFSYGRNLLLPCISMMHDTNTFRNFGINLLTNKDYCKIGNIDSHVVFKNLVAIDRLFFNHKWTLRLSQGLYAGEGYLLDTGGYPKEANDLTSHAVLGYGDVFDKDEQRSVNWHLYGQYGICKLEPSILISSPSVVIAAVEANLGVGPVVNDHERFGYKRLFRIVPDISGPVITLDFAVRKKLPGDLAEVAEAMGSCLLREIDRLSLEVVFVDNQNI